MTANSTKTTYNCPSNNTSHCRFELELAFDLQIYKRQRAVPIVKTDIRTFSIFLVRGVRVVQIIN